LKRCEGWLAIGGEPTALAVNRTTNKVFVTGSRNITVVAGDGSKVARSISVGARSRGIAVGAHRSVAYATKPSGNNLAIDTRAFLTSPLTAHGHKAYGVAISNSTGLVYIANALEGTVSVFADDPTKRRR
jgi:DNA-binding beta-propeller fold protein YncE